MQKNKKLYTLEKELRWLEEKVLYKRLQAIQIHEGQPSIMAYVYLHAGCNQYEIAQHLGLSRASVGVSIKRLVKSEFVEIRRNENDKRATSLHLTSLGTKTLVKSDMVLDSYISEKYRFFTQEELSNYIVLYEKMKTNLKHMYQEERK
ncbi:MAG: MarR family winged helix-turn-helix transcriptional regulator [Breznakia sp.]